MFRKLVFLSVCFLVVSCRQAELPVPMVKQKSSVKEMPPKVSAEQTYLCDETYTIDFAKSKSTNVSDMYACQTSMGTRLLPARYGAAEVLFTPIAPSGTRFTFQILTHGTNAIAVMVHGKQTSVHENFLTGSCGVFSTSGGVVGSDYVVLDSTVTTDKVSVRITCAL
ncbi:MAG: hypothetical protein NTX72_01155 [Candidatus Uhrbacteria bacterium]|nr:hypothetical protein [Candidatus Uhrbacteria bacterium]